LKFYGRLLRYIKKGFILTSKNVLAFSIIVFLVLSYPTQIVSTLPRDNFTFKNEVENLRFIGFKGRLLFHTVTGVSRQFRPAAFPEKKRCQHLGQSLNGVQDPIPAVQNHSNRNSLLPN